jgi:hypothetical protein
MYTVSIAYRISQNFVAVVSPNAGGLYSFATFSVAQLLGFGLRGLGR